PPSGGDDHDGRGEALDGGADGGDGDGVGAVRGARGDVRQVDEDVLLVEGRLGLHADGVHDLHSLQRVVPLGCLAGEHHAVGTIQHRIGHIRGLGTRGPRLLHHALQHLHTAGANDWLADHVALCDHHLLSQEHLLGGNLDAQVASSHHDAVATITDHSLSNALIVFNLANDLDILSLFSEHVANFFHT
ncbi:unnamed protein product, partial [Ixodes pacificus]